MRTKPHLAELPQSTCRLNQLTWDYFHILASPLVHLLTNRDISLIRRGRLYSSCVRRSMLHGSETWPVRKESEVALQRAEMRMVRWMCNLNVKDKVPSKELRKTRNRWYNIDTTAKQVVMAWACVVKRRHWLGEDMYGIWGGGLQTKM